MAWTAKVLSLLELPLLYLVDGQGNLFLGNCPTLQKKLRIDLIKMRLKWKV
jgi:hypothetical protein